MAQAANKMCELCMRAPGLHYCTQCGQVFCDDCKIIHLRSKISRNHTFINGSNINTEKKAGGCKDHNEDFVYLCADCDQLICRLCVTKAHLRHAVVDIKDSNKAVQTEISKYLDSKVDNVRSSAKLIEGQTKTYKTEIEATVKVITEHGNLIKEMVDKKVDTLIKALRKRESSELQSLSKANTDCKDLLGEATRQQQIYQDMIKQCDEVALFQKMKKVKSDLENLKSVDVTSLPSATYNEKSVNFSDVEKLFGDVAFQETEVAAEPHHQPTEQTQEKKKDQPAVTKPTAVKQYRYSCSTCRTERLSETHPSFKYWGLGYYTRVDCATCGKEKAHDYLGEA